MSGIRKKFVVMISKVFLSYHSKAGQPTNFKEKIASGEKRHTIRPNFESWKRRFDEIEKETADLHVKEWQGKPYRTPHDHIAIMTGRDKIGVSKLTYTEKDKFLINDTIPVTLEELAKNDGLSLEDFREWFKVVPAAPMAVIHFNSFRYGKD